MAEQLDWVVRGAVVYDGTGSPGRRADVGIRQDRIAAVGDGLVGRQVIDAGGLCAAPGFIDTHSHSDLRVLVEPGLPAKLRQGITLEVTGQDGVSVAPVREPEVAPRRRALAGLLTDPELSWSWRSVADYLDAVGHASPAVDQAYLVPHGAVREAILGSEDRFATDEELQRMRALLARCLDEGAFGMSTGLIYPPCCFCDRRELVALSEVLAARGLPIVVHLRSESDQLLESLDELFDVARRAKVHFHISHFKIAGRNNWPKLDRVIASVQAAQAEGLKVTADQYPYAAGSTMKGAILPPWVHAGGPAAAVQRLADPQARARIRAELLDPADVGWDNFWKWSGPEGIVIADIPSGRRREAVGKTVASAAAAVGQDPLDFALDLLRDEQLGVAMVSHNQSEEVVSRVMQLPYVNGCTDGLLGGKPHPRTYGSYPRILGRYVRELRVLPLEQAVRKLSGLAADTFGLHDHGYLRPGKRANVVLFDAAKVEDTATFEEPARYPRGITHVFVGGRLAVKDGEPTGTRAGKVLRRPPSSDRYAGAR